MVHSYHMSTTITLDQSIVEKLTNQVNALSRTLEQIRTTTKKNSVPLASKQEREEYARDKKVQAIIAQSRIERKEGKLIDYMEFRKTIDLT